MCPVSRILCLLAVVAVLTNSLVWSADAVAHLLEEHGSSEQLAPAEPSGSGSPESGQSDHADDNHHCCHQGSHLSALGTEPRLANVMQPRHAQRRLAVDATHGFFRSPFRPPIH
jgi:hypothetical protein